jgi:hypothetical protein
MTGTKSGEPGTAVLPVRVSDTSPPDVASSERRRRTLKLILIALAAEYAAGDEQRRKMILERRVAEVRRWLGAAFADGRTIEAEFRRLRITMSDEECEDFFHGFLDSCGRVIGEAHRAVQGAFVDAIAVAQERGGRRK